MVKSNATNGTNGRRNDCRVRVRMYRQGIGDSFLLTFYTGSKPAHILIDCGVLTGTENAAQWAKNICADVEAEAKSTDGKVHAIVGTHCHWDHLSGFWDARVEFGALTVDEVWLSWAEDPRDEFANAHRKQRALYLDAARRAVALLSAADKRSKERAKAIGEVLAFHGPEALGAAGGGRTEDALNELRKLGKPTYWKPGDLIAREWLPGVRVYILGPPRDEKLLGKMLGKKGSEMYGLGADSGFYAAVMHHDEGDVLSPEIRQQVERACPFDGQLLWNQKDAAKHPELAEVAKRYEGRINAWRGIDDAWLQSAEQLSLQLDNVVNNTSLVLAFEIVETGQVLLFAGDAQIGNWLSWGALSWANVPGGESKTIRTTDLLASTVFYKVGHHGSHNATLMQGGLEAMTHPDLVAAIPVDQILANGTRKWDMPAESLYPRLLEKTRGRVIRSDGAGPTASDPKRPPDDEVRGEFEKCVAVAPGDSGLYVDYHLG